MAAHPDREILGTSSDWPSSIECRKGPVAYTITVTGTSQGSSIRRTMRFYHAYSRIDFFTELNDVHDYTVVVAHLPLAAPVLEVRRPNPYGFSHGAVAVPNPELHQVERRALFQPFVRLTTPWRMMRASPSLIGA